MVWNLFLYLKEQFAGTPADLRDAMQHSASWKSIHCQAAVSKLMVVQALGLPPSYCLTA